MQELNEKPFPKSETFAASKRSIYITCSLLANLLLWITKLPNGFHNRVLMRLGYTGSACQKPHIHFQRRKRGIQVFKVAKDRLILVPYGNATFPKKKKRHPDDTELIVEDLVDLPPEDNQETQADDGIVDLLSIKELEQLHLILDTAKNLVDEIDANSQRREAFKMGIQNTFIPYKSILLGKRGTRHYRMPRQQNRGEDIGSRKWDTEGDELRVVECETNCSCWSSMGQHDRS
ncbi:hypothetical protein QE152_g1674 [Popillia japonica]|uniref:Uncharacterized protein n=1 Tax=Popillia japonica TaxID=7064 RepID=A0AAW1N9R0_POPJA